MKLVKRVAVIAAVVVAALLPDGAGATAAVAGSMAVHGTVTVDCAETCTGSFTGRWSGSLDGVRNGITYAVAFDTEASIELSSVTVACGPAGPSVVSATGTGLAAGELFPRVVGYWSKNAITMPVTNARMTFEVALDGGSVHLASSAVDLDVVNGGWRRVVDGPQAGAGGIVLDAAAGGCPGSATGSLAAVFTLA